MLELFLVGCLQELEPLGCECVVTVTVLVLIVL